MARNVFTLSTLLIFLVSGCATERPPKEDLSVHIGKSIKEVAEVMGRPSGIYNMQNGTYEYTWRGESSGTTGSNIGFGGVTVSQAKPNICRKVLVTNTQRIVIDARIEGKCKR